MPRLVLQCIFCAIWKLFTQSSPLAFCPSGIDTALLDFVQKLPLKKYLSLWVGHVRGKGFVRQKGTLRLWPSGGTKTVQFAVERWNQK